MPSNAASRLDWLSIWSLLPLTCYLYGIPFLSFRIISDTPGVEDHSSQYADFWGTMAERSFLTTWTFLSTLPDNL